MKWSWKIGRIGGIDLRVHATFFFLLAWLALNYYRSSGTAIGAARGVLFTIALFASVVLHEFGHAWAGRRVGVPTRDITLLPIGGVARLEYIPKNPWHELQIALAGPAVTVVIIALLTIVLVVLGAPILIAGDAVVTGGSSGILAQLMWVNVYLLVFNLLPAFPMDGGRVLRAGLALRSGYLRATAIAARVGRAFALLFGIVGLFYNPFLVLIALFVWLGAAAESSATQEHELLGGVTVDRVMIRELRTLAPDDTLETAMRHVLEGFQQDFPVLENGRVVGVLTRSGMLAGLGRGGPASPVSASMDSSFRTASPSEPVEHAVARLRECHCSSMPVMRDGQLAGVLTSENIAEFVMIATALRSSNGESKATVAEREKP
ncbi:MAG TPA: site-2 protease family protein [Gemmatimonadaceae bacterium]|jgi:Zn-dependent protease|nr:site-2 protease family protein [Gemmatimonadaceae bacterium]